MRFTAIRLAASILAICFSLPTLRVTAQSGPKAAWGFEEGSGSVAADSSGNNNSGTLLDSPAWVTGRIGGGLSFDGVDDGVQVPDAASLDFTTGVTMSAWIRMSNQPDNAAVLIKESTATGWSYALYFNNSHWLKAYVRLADGYHYAQLTEPLPLDEWLYVAATFDGTTIRLFVNGEESATESASGSIVTSNESLWLGVDQNGGDRFAGEIDELRLYDRALSQSEIINDATLAADPSAPLQVTAVTPADGALGVKMDNWPNR